jgi:iron(III) transport system substrate-binding protein
MRNMHKNVTSYTRSGQAQAKSVAKGEVSVGVSFIFGFDNETQQGFPVKSAAPCEGTGFEIGGIALIKGARNTEGAKRYYDWLMSPAGQAIGAQANSLQIPANKTFAPDKRIPKMDNVRLIKYDFEKYGKAAERRRLIERWQKEVEAAPKS